MYTLITGASSGVGRELAIYLSRYHPLILNGRNEKRLAETKGLCSGENDIILWPYDLSCCQNLENDFSVWLREQKSDICSFVHCAGVMKMVPIRGITAEILETTYAVNVFAAELLVKVLASKKNNSKNLKTIVFVSSNISNRGAAAFTAYGGSKAALDGLMRNLSIELAPNVRVNSVLPGGMMTEMTKDLFSNGNMKNEFEKNYPLGIGTPEDIAPAVKFLLSDDSRWITGQQITIDGGRTTDITEGRK